MSNEPKATHEIKCWPEFFNPAYLGDKPFEIRLNDRDFKVGDTILLREYDNKKDRFTGDWVFQKITYITDFKQKRGYVVLATETIELSPPF